MDEKPQLAPPPHDQDNNNTDTTISTAEDAPRPQTPSFMPVGTAEGGGRRVEEGEVGARPTAAAAAITVMRTLDGGEAAGDEFAREAADYQTLLGKIDALLERLGLDA